jgi:glycerophosphoryl diester phosphodiesterase
VIAHRGASADCPENTLAAFDEALRLRCDGIELDVQLSRDGVPVVFHDRTLARAGDAGRAVSQLDWTELQRLRLGGEHLPGLQEVLARYAPATELLIELKSYEAPTAPGRLHELIRLVVALVRQSAATDRVQILSFDWNVLGACRELAPELRRVLNLKPPPLLPPTLGPRLGELSAISADVATLTPAFAAGVQRAGLPLLCYTCNTPQQLERALECGARGIMSDRPGWLREQLARRGSP